MTTPRDEGLKDGPTPGMVPVPDPTTLTNALVAQAIKALREALEARMDGDRDLYEEKFTGVGARFQELNTRLTEGDRYKQTALDAGLKAAQTLVDEQQENSKEGLKKTEELFGKQIDALQQTVDDLKGIVRRGAGSNQGAIQAIGWVVGAAGVIAAIVTAISAIMSTHFSH
jgi:hypothetical protein